MEAVFGQGFRDYASRVGSFVISCFGTPRLDRGIEALSTYKSRTRTSRRNFRVLTLGEHRGAQADFCTMNFSGAVVGQASITGKKSIEVKGWLCGIW